MNTNIESAVFSLIGVVIGSIMTFLVQFLLHLQKEKSDRRMKAADLKYEQCLPLWFKFAETYQYLFFTGDYSSDKIDLDQLRKHLKELTGAISRVEPFLSRDGFLDLLKVRDCLNEFLFDPESGLPGSGEEYLDFIVKLEDPMGKARDIFRKELAFVELGVVSE